MNQNKLYWITGAIIGLIYGLSALVLPLPRILYYLFLTNIWDSIISEETGWIALPILTTITGAIYGSIIYYIVSKVNKK
ncbi:MAG: hypothetical protein AABW82_03850 [Nanoarchaeota archaeon]